MFLKVHPEKLGKNWSNLTTCMNHSTIPKQSPASICFRWVGSTTNQLKTFMQEIYDGLVSVPWQRIIVHAHHRPVGRNMFPGVKKRWEVMKVGTLQGINISHLGKRKIIFKMPFWGDMLVSWRVAITLNISRTSWMNVCLFIWVFVSNGSYGPKECSNIRFLKWTWRPHEKYGWHPPLQFPLQNGSFPPPDLGENWKGDKIWEFFPTKWILERHVFLIGKRAEQHPEELLGWVRTGCQGGSRVGMGLTADLPKLMAACR